MPQICHHCRHVRKEGDAAPEWQCPACERAYAKSAGSPTSGVAPGSGQAPRARTADGRGRWLVALVVLGAALWLSRPFWPGLAATAGGAGSAQPEVVLYATSWCGYCAKARDFFRENRIEYIELDVEKSEIARDAHRQLGGGGVPVIMVGDKVIRGFNQPELRRALGPWLKDS